MTTQPLSKNSWQYRALNALTPGLDHFSDALLDEVAAGQPIVAGTADLQYSNGLSKFAMMEPKKFVQFGISEQNMVSAAAGMAACGQTPYVATFASFLALLCCEQIRMDVAYSRLPVRLVGHHAGISLGFYGTSHHATEDLAIMRSIAKLTVLAPSDGNQLRSLIRAARNWKEPIYFRIARGRDPEIYAEPPVLEIGKGIELQKGADLTIIATGSSVHPAKAAVEQLIAQGLSVGLVDMHTIKPIDGNLIRDIAGRTGAILTVEEHNVIGGLGGAVAEVLADEGSGVKLTRHGIFDEYSLIAPPTHLYRHYKLDAEGIEDVARGVLQ